MAKPFVRLFLGLLVVWIAAQAAFNWLVNPWGLYATNFLPARVADERHQKSALLRQMRPPPAILILGSSRMMRIPPSVLRERTGLPAFNAALPGAYPVDMLALYRFAVEEVQAPLQTVIVGVDPLIFFGGEGNYKALERNTELRRFLPNHSSFTADVGGLSLLMSPAQSKDGFRSLIHAVGLGKNQRDLWRIFEADGFQSRNYQDGARDEGTWSVAKVVDRQLKGWYVNPKKKPNPNAFREIEDLVARCQRARQRAIIVATPTIAQLQAHWRTTGFAEQEQVIRTRLASIAQAHGAQFTDFSSVERFGGDPDEFYDALHPTLVNTRRMIEALFPDANDTARAPRP